MAFDKQELAQLENLFDKKFGEQDKKNDEKFAEQKTAILTAVDEQLTAQKTEILTAVDEKFATQKTEIIVAVGEMIEENILPQLNNIQADRRIIRHHERVLISVKQALVQP